MKRILTFFYCANIYSSPVLGVVVNAEPTVTNTLYDVTPLLTTVVTV